MKKLFIVGNWKSNKTIAEAKTWLLEISNFQFPISDKREIIICPPFLLIPEMKTFIDEYKLPLKLGVQNISPFGEGAYTGEVSARTSSSVS